MVLLLLGLAALPAWAADPCGQLRGGAPLIVAPLLRSADQAKPDPPADYRHRLQTTPWGWPLQATWCVWVQPEQPATASSLPNQRWQEAVSRALREWQQLLPIVLVSQPERAQVTVWRRRPPLGRDGSGRPRASHGRAIISLRQLGEGPGARVEPRVEVMISPEQRLEAIQATALHELGHAFGLWGHSDDPVDALAVSPGAKPVLQLSARDRATLEWLYRQPTPMRSNP